MLKLNIASAEELLSLEGIGAQRASAIIKLRDEKGYITLNDIEENLHSTASTLQKLLQEERISFEIPPNLVESIKERQDGEHKKAMDNVAKEFDKKLNQVHEHYKTMQKNYEDEMNKMTQMMRELEMKISDRKSESLVTGEIVDKLAPYGIYGTRDDGKIFQGSLKLEKSDPGPEASGGSASGGTADRGLAIPGPTSNVSGTKV